jgi:hypothetical protein
VAESDWTLKDWILKLKIVFSYWFIIKKVKNNIRI